MAKETQEVKLLVTFEVTELHNNIESQGVTPSQRTQIDESKVLWTASSLSEAVTYELRGVLELRPRPVLGVEPLPNIAYAEATVVGVELLPDELRIVGSKHPYDLTKSNDRVETSPARANERST